MSSTMFRAGAAAALLWATGARADDADRTQQHDRLHDADQTQQHDRLHDGTGDMQRDRQHDAVHQAMHEAMQQQMATPPAGMAAMPGMQGRATADAGAMKQRAGEMQRVREAARQRAMRRGTQDAAIAQGSDATHNAMHESMHAGGGMAGGDSCTPQQGAGMMRTGDMHGGTGGMMPGGDGSGGMMNGSGGSGGMMGGTTGGTTTPSTGTGGTMGSTGTMGSGTMTTSGSMAK